jgi:hypothetical protein
VKPAAITGQPSRAAADVSGVSPRKSGHRTGKFGWLRSFSCAWPHDASAAATAKATRRKKVPRSMTLTANMFGQRTKYFFGAARAVTGVWRISHSNGLFTPNARPLATSTSGIHAAERPNHAHDQAAKLGKSVAVIERGRALREVDAGHLHSDIGWRTDVVVSTARRKSICFTEIGCLACMLR